MAETSDILIVGGGTAGSYLGRLLSSKGLTVTIVERDTKGAVGQRLEVIHFETDRLRNSGLPPAPEGSEEIIGVWEEDTVVSPDYRTYTKVKALQTVVRLPLFLERIHDLLKSEDVRIEFDCKSIEPLFEGGKLKGVVAEKGGEQIEFRAKMIVDASGKTAVIRRALPPEYGVETFALGPNDVMHVLLQYLKWKKPQEPYPPFLHSYTYYLAWLGPAGIEHGAILGIGQPGSFDNAIKVRDDFLKTAKFPPYEVVKSEQGSTPYRRPPYSLVGDAFLCIGDAAAITYPFSGHGVTATWNLCKIAADVIDTVSKAGELTRESLWDINVRYFREQGAKFAGLLAQLSGIINLSERDLNYIFEKGLAYRTGGKDGELPEPNREYEQDPTFQEMLKLVGALLFGVLKGKLSFANVLALIGANTLGGKIRAHYEKFPEDPAAFDDWVREADALWSKKKMVVKKYPSATVEYH